jgi:hypothetical protein
VCCKGVLKLNFVLCRIRPLHTTIDYLLGIEYFAGPRLRLSADKGGASTLDAIEAETEAATAAASAWGGVGTMSGGGGISSRLSQWHGQPLLFDYESSMKRTMRVFVRLVVTALVVAISIFLPDFDRGKSFLPRSTFRSFFLKRLILFPLPVFLLVMAFLGAMCAFVICVHGPVLAHMRIFRGRISKVQLAIDSFLIALATVSCQYSLVQFFERTPTY